MCGKYLFHNVLTRVNMYMRTYRPEEGRRGRGQSEFENLFVAIGECARN